MMALPGRDRDLHVRPTPYLGGMVLLVAFATAGLISVHLDYHGAGLLVLCGITALVFLADDRVELPAWSKLAIQCLVAVAAIWGFWPDFAITYLTVPGFHQVNIAWPLAVGLSLFWLVGMQNTVNLLDGVDGLAAGVVGIVAATLAIAAASRGQIEVVMFACALTGACAGFLAFNFHPARIFMGDSGAMFLGLALGLLSIAGVAKVAVAFALIVPVMALAVPIADTAWAIVRRRRQRVSIAHADSRHIHHQLLDFGLSQPQTCLVFYAATGILGSFGLMIFGHRRVLAIAIVLLVVALSTVGGDALRSPRWRLGAPVLRRLLSDG